MDIEIVRPTGKDALLMYLIDEDECRLIATYRFPPAADFPMPDHVPGYERAIAARNDVVDWLNRHIPDIRAEILEQYRSDKDQMEKALLSDAEPGRPARRWDGRFWTALARVTATNTIRRFVERGRVVRGIDEIVSGLLEEPPAAEPTRGPDP